MFFFSSKNSFQGTTKEITETAFPFRMVALDMNGEPVQALAANESIILQFEPVGIPGNYIFDMLSNTLRLHETRIKGAN